jgi:hypothetical protein
LGYLLEVVVLSCAVSDSTHSVEVAKPCPANMVKHRSTPPPPPYSVRDSVDPVFS